MVGTLYSFPDGQKLSHHFYLNTGPGSNLTILTQNSTFCDDMEKSVMQMSGNYGGIMVTRHYHILPDHALIVEGVTDADLLDITDRLITRGNFPPPHPDAARQQFNIQPPGVTNIIVTSSPPSIIVPPQRTFAQENKAWLAKEINRGQLEKLGLTPADFSALESASDIESLRACKYDIGQGKYASMPNISVQNDHKIFEAYYAAAENWGKAAAPEVPATDFGKRHLAWVKASEAALKNMGMTMLDIDAVKKLTTPEAVQEWKYDIEHGKVSYPKPAEIYNPLLKAYFAETQSHGKSSQAR